MRFFKGIFQKTHVDKLLLSIPYRFLCISSFKTLLNHDFNVDFEIFPLSWKIGNLMMWNSIFTCFFVSCRTYFSNNNLILPFPILKKFLDFFIPDSQLSIMGIAGILYKFFPFLIVENRWRSFGGRKTLVEWFG